MKKLMLLPAVLLSCLFSLTLAPEFAVAENCRLNSDCPLINCARMAGVWWIIGREPMWDSEAVAITD